VSLIKRMRRQKAVLWVRSESPNDFGKFSFDSPIEIKCRWDDKIGQFKNKEGQTFSSLAVVYVDRDVKIGDKLKKGTLDSQTQSDPTKDQNAYEVKAVENIPNLRNTETLRIARL